jgi:hypothetical protein
MGESIPPCGTPAFIVDVSEKAEPCRIWILRFSIYDFMNRKSAE